MPGSISHGRELMTDGFGRAQEDLPPFDQGRLDPREWFDIPGRSFEIEIGSGKGTYLIQTAPGQPQTNFLGIEVARKYYRYAADRMRRRQLSNVQMLGADAVEFLTYRCVDAIAHTIHIYFSDPWPKARHHKRRVIQDESLRQFHRILQPEGQVRLVTDHDDLWAWYEEHAARSEALFERTEFGASGGELVGTNYERKFSREGRPFHAMTLLRRDQSG